MKKFFVSFAVVATFVGYALRQHFHVGQDDALPIGSSPNSSTTSTSTTNNSEVSVPVNNTSSFTPTNTSTRVRSSGAYRNGTYTGTVADAFYGNVQVQASIKGGKLVDVQFLQYPNDRGHSIEVSNVSTPILRQEAIQAQNANVDIVSGATATSQAFQQSLASALSQAK
ncbi:MAG: FMN-binding protein [Candidatus Kerfeldbacteria bacterium]|nr:FMN-binding protein [Candidatus Kerfeldbacteria bacterium]